jgi:predicted nucleic acid-binding protein
VADKKSDIPSIYIDSVCFIDAAIHSANGKLIDGRLSDVDYLKLILSAAKTGDIKAYSSIITIAECTHAHGKLDDEVKRLFKSILTSGEIIILIQPDILIAERARDLKWEDGIDSIRGADAIHVASALHLECSEFLTLDGAVMRKAVDIKKLGLRVIKPSETQVLPEEYKQPNLLEYALKQIT